MNRPLPDEYSAYYQKYVESVGNDVLAELEAQLQSFPAFLGAIPPEKEEWAYAPGKWTIKELLRHVIDTERVMAYRFLRTCRKDPTPLPGFDENEYVKNSKLSTPGLAQQIEEFTVLRKANLYLFRSVTDESLLSFKGIANKQTINARALLYIIAGHLNHHRRIISERYL